MTEIYLAENHLLLKSGYSAPQMHSHSACHVLVGLQGDICVITEKETVMCRGAILPSGTVHTVEGFGAPFLVFLFDITSTVSEQMRCFTVLQEQTAESIVRSYQMLTVGNRIKDYGKFFGEVMGLIGIKEVCSRITDERIRLAMEFVEDHLQDAVTVKEAAGAVYLSESRFSYLFREQAGIAFSSWLVFKRLFCAYMKIAEGLSITEASLAAGFSTPSHFATVNKKMFGITACDLSGDYCLYRIADI